MVMVSARLTRRWRPTESSQLANAGFGKKACTDRIGWHGTYVADDTYDVFVSYSRADGRHAADIDSVLCDKGLKIFFDRRGGSALGSRAGTSHRHRQGRDRVDQAAWARETHSMIE
jgi:hypothetical protein